MDANEIYEAIGDRSRYDAVGEWAIAECAVLRRTALAFAEEAAKPPAAKSTDTCGTRSIGIDDVNEEYVSQAELGDMLKASCFAKEEFKKIPPEFPTPDEAVYWMARSQLLRLIDQYSMATIGQVGFQRGLHDYRRGLRNDEVRNLFCEPSDDTAGLFLWASLLVTLHGDMDHVERNHLSLLELAKVFGWLADIYYDLTQAVYSTKLVGKCRRAFSTFWRRVGVDGFAPYYNEYIKCREALDTAIVNGTAGRFLDVNLCLASIAQSSIGINKSLLELRSLSATTGAAAPQVEAKPATRGPKGARKNIPVKYAAEVYGVSKATISNWDKGKGAVPLHYPGRDVSIDEFNNAAAADKMAMGKKEGVMSRVSEALRRRGPTPSRPENNGATPSRPESNGTTPSRPKNNGATPSRPENKGPTPSRPKNNGG